MADQEQRLAPYLGPAGAWAMALGTSIGWGSLVITGGAWLAKAGPAGSVLGLLAGALLMLIIARNYHYMMICRPDAGGVYTYAKECFGHDYGFLAAWFLSLTYLAMFWANATAIPLFARYFLGDDFEFVRLYSIFDYDIYLGEILLTASAIILFSAICLGRKKAVAGLMTGFAACFSLAIAVCFAAAMRGMGQDGAPAPFDPAFAPNAEALSQVVKIALVSPWAFIGFESISHAAGEFDFHPNKSFRILVAAAVSATVLYTFVILLSASAWPERYATWFEYIRDLPNLQGIEGLPAFYAARHYLGDLGIGILMMALLALVLSSLGCNILALSRLFYALARDGVLPGRFAALNRHGVPARAVMLVAAVSLAVPFLGRTAIGWIVDVTVLGATLVYAIASACAWKQADVQADSLEKWTGMAGAAVMSCFAAWPLASSLFSESAMEPESYFLFVVWSVLGFLFFRNVLNRDKSGRFGRSVIVWIAILSLVLFVSLIWMNQSIINSARECIAAMQTFCEQHGDSTLGARQLDAFRLASGQSLALVIVIFGAALGVVLNNYAVMTRRALESETRLGNMERKYTVDPMTGVRSKHCFSDTVEEIDGRIARGQAEPFAVAVCDVNGLKHVNDTYGHKAGDEYIKSAARMISHIFVHSPVFRNGGDEFVVLLKGDDYGRRLELMQRLHDLSVEHIDSGEVVVSGGLSDFAAGEDRNLHAVFERADRLMYQEKKLLKSLGAITRDDAPAS